MNRTAGIVRPCSGARRLLERAVEELGFSARAHDRVLRVAKTIADLEGERAITEAHLLGHASVITTIELYGSLSVEDTRARHDKLMDTLEND